MLDQIYNPNDTYTWNNALNNVYRGNNSNTPIVKQGTIVNVSRENHLAQVYDVQELETGSLFLGCKYISPTGGFNGVGRYAPLDEGTLVSLSCANGSWDEVFITGVIYTEGNYDKYYQEGKLQEFAQLEEYSNQLYEIQQPSGHPNRITDPAATINLYGTNNLYDSFTSPEFTDNLEDKAKANRQPGIIDLATSVGDKVNYAFNSIINYTANIINVAEGTAESKCAKLVDFANYYNRQADLLAQTSIIKETTPEEAKKTTGIKPIVSKQSNVKSQSSLRSPFPNSYFIDQYKKLAQMYLEQAQACNRGDAARQLVGLQMQAALGSELPQGEQYVEGQQNKPDYKPKEEKVPVNTKPRGCKYKDATQLIQVENGVKLHPDAAKAFVDLKKAAQKEGIKIILVSGFRSITDQQAIINRKRKEGQSDSQIFKVNAKPGFSEHHTGYAMDLDDGLDKKNLNQSFEQTDAFKFIQKNATKFGLELSYFKGNSEGIDYEPWHWRFVGNQKAKDTLFCSTSQNLSTTSNPNSDFNIFLQQIKTKYNLHSIGVKTNSNFYGVDVNSSPLTPASTIKLIVADLILDKLQSGNLSLSTLLHITEDVIPVEGGNLGTSITVENCLIQMLKNSTNLETNMLIKNLGGLNQINNLLSGYSSTRFVNYLNMSADKRNPGNNKSTVTDISTALNKIYSSTRTGTSVVRNALETNIYKFNYSNAIANKAGFTTQVTGNAGLVSINNKSYIISMFTNINGTNFNPTAKSVISKATQDIINFIKNSKDV